MDSKDKLRKLNRELDRINSPYSSFWPGMLAVVACVVIVSAISLFNTGITGMASLNSTAGECIANCTYVEMPAASDPYSLVLPVLIFAVLALSAVYVGKREVEESRWVKKHAAKASGIITFLFGSVGQFMIRASYMIALYFVIPIVKAGIAVGLGIRIALRFAWLKLRRIKFLFSYLADLAEKSSRSVIIHAKGKPFEPEIEKINWELKGINRAEKMSSPEVVRLRKFKDEIDEISEKLRELNLKDKINGKNKK